VCTADLGFTAGKNDIGAGTDTDFIGACTPALTRDTIVVTNLSRIPSGRPIAATLGTLHIINVYAPFGTSKRAERESFNNDLPFFLESASDDVLLGGDFNCVLEAADSTGYGSFSHSLATLVQGYALREAW
jgi:exonuclease III